MIPRTDLLCNTLFNMPYIDSKIILISDKKISAPRHISSAHLATASVVYSHTNSNNQIYAQVDLQNSTAGVKITSPATSQKVPVGQLIVLGTSTDNSTTDCQVLRGPK